MQKTRRSVWQLIADKAGAVRHLTRAEWMAAFRLGAGGFVVRPEWMPQSTYRAMMEEHATIAYEYLIRGKGQQERETGGMARLMDERSIDLAQPEPSEKQGAPRHSVTSSLPIVGPDGYYLNPGEKARRFWQQQAGK